MPLEADVLTIGHQLEKNVSDGKADNSSTSDLLNRLKEIPVTLDILQKTRIGMTVNVVRKASTDDDIQVIAKGLIKSWKKLLDSQDKTKMHRQSSQDKEKDKEKETNSTSKSSSSSSNLSRSDSTSSNSSASYTIPTVNDPVRMRCREMIANSIKSEKRPDFNPAYIAADVEEAIYKMFKDTGPKYKNRVKSRVMNLRDKRNEELRSLLMDGTITPEKFANMTSEEMACDELKKERSEITKQAIKDHQLATTTGTQTGLFKCGRCGQRKTTYNQVQTRSADEPMTTFVFCLECGNRWKFC